MPLLPTASNRKSRVFFLQLVLDQNLFVQLFYQTFCAYEQCHIRLGTVGLCITAVIPDFISLCAFTHWLLHLST